MKIKSLLKVLLVCTIYLVATSFQYAKSLKGVWRYEGGIYNNQIDGPPKNIKLERVYTDNEYEGFITKKDGKKVRYEAGNYAIHNNVYQETQTYADQSSSLKGKTLHYTYTIHNDKLTYKGSLPDKSPVVEYWKKVK
jgi:hypothetical protein